VSSPHTKLPDTDASRRLALLDACGISETTPEADFADVAAIAAAICRAPIAFVSFFDDKRQWFKGMIGCDVRELPIEQSICFNALADSGPSIIHDLTVDPRTNQSPLVTDTPHARFYAAAPLSAWDGTIIGSVGVMDTSVRTESLDERQTRALDALARQIMSHLRARSQPARTEPGRHSDRNLTSLNTSNALLTHESDKVGPFDIDLATGVAAVSASLCRIFGIPIAKTYLVTSLDEFTVPEDLEISSAAWERRDAAASTNVVYRIRTPAGELKWIARSAVIDLDDFGSPARMIGTVQDVTEQKKATIRMEAKISLGDRLRELNDIQSVVLVASDLMAKSLDAIRAGFGIVDAAAETITVRNEWLAPGTASVTGTHRFRDYGDYIDDLKNGQPVVILDITQDPRTRDRVARFSSMGVRSMVNLPIINHGQLQLVVFVHHDHPYAWPEEELVFIRSFGDRVQLAIARIQAEHDQDTLNREIGHRLKNTFAMVQAIAHQTLRGVSEKHLVSTFAHRLAALSGAHDILLSGDHQGATVREVVAGFARTLSVEGRVDIAGPEVTLGSRGTLSLSLLLHELGTNAIKYGSLSNEHGRVNVSWKLVGEHEATEFRLVWKEVGGPPAREPDREGFGSKLGSDAHLLTCRFYDTPIRRACSKSSFALPYIWRLMSFKRVICPSVCPFDHGEMIAFLTASRSFSTPQANDPTRLLLAASSQSYSSGCLRADHRLEVTDGRAGNHKVRDVHFDRRHEDCLGLCKVIARGGHEPSDDPCRWRSGEPTLIGLFRKTSALSPLRDDATLSRKALRLHLTPECRSVPCPFFPAAVEPRQPAIQRAGPCSEHVETLLP
jgi:two-component sensor histidine kinase/PAS domain-containing protein